MSPPRLADRRVLIVTGDKEEIVPPKLAALARAIGSSEWTRHLEAPHAWRGAHEEWLTTTIVEWLTT